LREGDETEFGIAGNDELVDLTDVFPLNEAGLQCRQHTQPGHGFDGSRAVGCGLRIGQCQMFELAGSQHLAAGVDQIGIRRPQDQLADGVGEARTGDGVALLLQSSRHLVVSREQDFEGRAVRDLGVELAGSAKSRRSLVAGVLLKLDSDLLHRRGEVGGDSDLDFVGAGADGGEQGDKQGHKAFHRGSPEVGCISNVPAKNDRGSLEDGAGLLTDGQAEALDAVVRDDGADRLAALHVQGDFGIHRAVVDARDFAPQVVAGRGPDLGVVQQQHRRRLDQRADLHADGQPQAPPSRG
jgi:hypothetical protein